MNKIHSTKKTIGQKFSPILAEIEDALWDFEYYQPNERPDYSVFGVRAAIKIFMSVLLDKMWEKQQANLMPQADREKQAEEVGQEIREFFKKYTGIDSHLMYKI